MSSETIIQYDDLPERLGYLRDFRNLPPGQRVLIPRDHPVMYETPKHPNGDLVPPFATLLSNHLRHTCEDFGYTLYFTVDVINGDITVWFGIDKYLVH